MAFGAWIDAARAAVSRRVRTIARHSASRLSSRREPLPLSWQPHDPADRLARRARQQDSPSEARHGSPSGGLAVLARYGQRFFSSIGARGGSTVLEERGIEHMQAIGARGGAATRARYGPEHYREIGRRGGQAGRGSK